MVPRDPDPDSSRHAARIPARLFAAWRRVLGTGAARTSRVARSTAQNVSRSGTGVMREFASSIRTGEPMVHHPRSALAIGIAATATGAIITQVLAPARDLTQAGALALVSILWVLARLVVMRLAAVPGTGADATLITSAWMQGALAQAVAVNPALRTAAWIIGFALCVRGLRAGAMKDSDALRLAAWGFGIEVVGFFLVAAGRSLEVALRVFAGV